ncbi:MAG: DUF5011 domain-containing protein [Agarilytica sp.]
MKKKLMKHLAAAAVFGASLFSSQVFANIYYEEFLARLQQGFFNTSIMTYQAGYPPVTMMDMPATPITINSASVFGLADFKLELPNLSNYYALKQQIVPNALGGQTWIGDVVHYDPLGLNNGVKGRAYFVESASGITGTIYTEDKVLQIYTDGAGGQVIVEADEYMLDSEGPIVSAADLGEGETAASPLVAGHRDGPSPASLAAPYTIDVLWVTTQLARDSGADMEALIELATTTGNDVLVNSNVPAQFRIVGIHHNTTYAEDSSDMGGTLSDLRLTTDGNMDEVHGMRTDLGADMVSLVSGATNYCGIAYLQANYSLAFSVNGRGCMSGHTPIHEFGHNFGAHHDKANGNGNNSTYSFGHGYFNNTNDPYFRTVMSYGCPGGGCPRISHFSDSQQSHEGLPIGSVDEYDNARLMRIRAGEMSGLAPRLTSTCTEHTATNSTHVNEGRAYTETELWTTYYYAVGSGEQLSGYSFSSSTLAEEPAGYYTPGTCGADNGETQFGPEIQSLNPSLVSGGLRLEGKVFDGNADAVSAVRVRETGATQWTLATINGLSFSVDVPVTVNNNTVYVDIQTEDANGDTFEFSTDFEMDAGDPPVVEISYSTVFDATARVQVTARDPDNRPAELRYQINGSGDPAQGTWTSYTEEVSYNNHTFQLYISGLSEGTHTIHVYVVDETGNNSNVENVDVTILPAAAPECTLTSVAPALNNIDGQVEITALYSDANYGHVDLEYRVNSGAWTVWGNLELTPQINGGYFRLPDTFAESTNLTLDLRATDSSGLQTDCGTKTHTVSYPTTNLAPSCEIVDVWQEDSVLKFYMTVSDPNGDANSMYGKTSAMTDWLQTWPGPLTQHWVPNTGFGVHTVEGRVLDYTDGLEGLCSATYTVIDTGDTPEIDYAQGYYDRELNFVNLEATPIDDDGDVTLVEFREVGTSTWQAAVKSGTDVMGRTWTLDPGLLAEGNYDYEVRATDSGSRVSAPYTFNFTVEYEYAPTLDSLTHTLDGRTINVSGTKSDSNNNDRYVWYKLNDQEWASFWENDAAFTFSISAIEDGSHTLEVFVEDTYDNRSASQFINFDIDGGQPPVITSVTYNIIDETQVTFTITADDPDGDALILSRSYDGAGQGTFNSGSYSWGVAWMNPGFGSHTAEFFVTDSLDNQSDTYTVNFEIVDSTPCFEDTNANHETAGRAYSVEVCSYELFGTCYGTLTTTWYAQGSDTDLGTSASTVTSLLETSTGHYEVGACNDATPPVITLSGNNPMDVAIGQTFVEPGYTATDNVDGDITANVVVTGSVDTNTAGAYQLTYSVSDSSGNPAQNVVRTVNVIADTVKPVISIPTGTSYTVTLNNSFSNPTATATDNVDGDISANIVVTGSVDTTTIGTYYLNYNVSDAAGNTADQVIVTVEVVDQVDTTPPVIALTGSAAITITVGDSYSEPGYSATDNVDGDISASVVVGGDTVNPNAVGTYVVTYNVTDAAGNAATQVTRTVTVEAQGGACFTDSLDNHVTAARVEILYGSSYYTIVPAGQTAEYLGSTYVNASDVISLEETAPGHWTKVTSCN